MGAPFRPTSRWGLSIQSGVVGGLRDVTLHSGFRNDDPPRALRPFVGASGRSVLGHFGDSVQSTGSDLGLAFAP